MAKRVARTPITTLTPKQIKSLETKLKQFVTNVKSHRGIQIDRLLAGHGSHFQQ